MKNRAESKKFSIKTDFNMLTILIIPIAVAVNFTGYQLTTVLKIPLFLDTIGTIFAAIIGGPWVGALAGALTNLLNCLTAPSDFPFVLVSIAVGLTTGFLSRAKMFSNFWKSCISAVIIAFVSVLISTPIVVLLYGGVTGSGTSLVTAVLLASGADIWKSVIGGDSIFTLADRAIACVIALGVIRVIPDRTLIKFSCGRNYIKEKKTAPEASLAK